MTTTTPHPNSMHAETADQLVQINDVLARIMTLQSAFSANTAKQLGKANILLQKSLPDTNLEEKRQQGIAELHTQSIQVLQNIQIASVHMQSTMETVATILDEYIHRYSDVIIEVLYQVPTDKIPKEENLKPAVQKFSKPFVLLLARIFCKENAEELAFIEQLESGYTQNTKIVMEALSRRINIQDEHKVLKSNWRTLYRWFDGERSPPTPAFHRLIQFLIDKNLATSDETSTLKELYSNIRIARKKE